MPRTLGCRSRFAGLTPPSRWPRPRSAPRPDVLAAGVETLPRVGPAVRSRLAKLGLRTVGDLLYHRPRRYERPIDERSISRPLRRRRGRDPGSRARDLVAARPRPAARSSAPASRTTPARSRRPGSTSPGSRPQLTPGTQVRLRGKPNRYGFQVESYDLGEATETADFAPVYPASEELAQKQLRALVAAALEHVRADGDALPAALAVAERLPLRADALVAMHHPRSPEEAEEGRRRLAFDELLVLQLALARRTAERERLVADGAAAGRRAPRRATARCSRSRSRTPRSRRSREIDADLARTTPMQRLLQGDVGSGKTVVALCDAAARRRGGPAGRADGADGGARRAALPHGRGDLHRARRAGGAADERARREGARQRAAADRLRRRADRDRHARADPEGGRASATSPSPSSTSSTASASSSAPRSRRAAARTSST